MVSQITMYTTPNEYTQKEFSFQVAFLSSVRIRLQCGSCNNSECKWTIVINQPVSISFENTFKLKPWTVTKIYTSTRGGVSIAGLRVGWWSLQRLFGLNLDYISNLFRFDSIPHDVRWRTNSYYVATMLYKMTEVTIIRHTLERARISHRAFISRT